MFAGSHRRRRGFGTPLTLAPRLERSVLRDVSRCSFGGFGRHPDSAFRPLVLAGIRQLVLLGGRSRDESVRVNQQRQGCSGGDELHWYFSPMFK